MSKKAIEVLKKEYPTIYNENKMHQKNDYFDTIDLLIRTRPRQHGLTRRILDQKIHIGIFDFNIPLQSLQ